MRIIQQTTLLLLLATSAIASPQASAATVDVPAAQHEHSVAPSEPWTVAGCGYLNLLATGELCEQDTIHDLVPELLAPRYDGRVAPGFGLFLSIRARSHKG